ncbi:MAG TPA: LacI family DNA-binding transcriptional regulator [Anaerolineaceae bacterium]|jgi:DNA-binding LacI/PurR family transcriptional regulator|nr:LacI family DNA-binding transcriptional regulator [Anaerolineaceae bacterium]
MTITIRDIAQKLNLSIAAVSRALDGYPDISPETRERVIKAAQEMGYVPNRAARQLRRQKSDTIGYIMPVHSPRFADSYYSEFIEGMGDEAAKQGFDLLISIAPPQSSTEQRVYQQWVQGGKVDGLVLNRICVHDWRVQYLHSQQKPFAGLERSEDGIDYPHIAVNNRTGFLKLVEHVLQYGFDRVAYIGGPDHLKIQADRLAGYQAGLSSAGLYLDPAYLCSGDLTSQGGYTAARQLLDLPIPPNAILCVNDQTAFGALHAADEAGLRIGEQIAIAGFDGVRDARYSNPPLTTVDQPVYDIARQLVHMLADQIRGEPMSARSILIEPQLLLRASTGA